MWNSISSFSDRSVARGAKSARRRAANPLMALMVTPARRFARDGRTTETIGSLGGLQDELDRFDIPAPACGLGADRAAASGTQPVVLGAPVVLRRAPFTLDPPLLLEPLEGGIERTLIGI